MTSPAHGALRLLRGGVLTAVATLCALAGHVVAGGAILGLAALVVAGWLGAAFVLLADRRRGFADILVASFAAQVVFHVIFAITCHGSQGPAPLLPDAPMVAGHAAAAACLAGLLAYGERVLWGLYHAFRLVFVPVVTLPLPEGPGGGRPVGREPGGPAYDLLLASAQPRRGPPVPVA